MTTLRIIHYNWYSCPQFIGILNKANIQKHWFHYLKIGFLALQENKVDLVWFLWDETVKYAPCEKTIVISGGLTEENDVCCNLAGFDVQYLSANHEETNTTMILHAIHCKSMSNAVNMDRYTDVSVLLTAHI